MTYQEHKKHFYISYKTGTDAWTHPYTNKESLRLTEKLAPGSVILDVGSGRGYLAKHLAEMGFKVIGIDFESEIVKKINEDRKDWGLAEKLKFAEADALNIPFEDASFDAVTDFGLFETLFKEDWGTYAKEINRVLKPGGFYLNVSLSHDTAQFFEFYPKKGIENDFEKYGIHYHFFSKDEMVDIFKDKFALVSQANMPAAKNEKMVLLETLFQKLKK